MIWVNIDHMVIVILLTILSKHFLTFQ